ncbi:translation initiation factor eIF3 subunit [Aureobasidium sp. EXF-3400]|nr:translation initiation factor eIF3 subunit [Aureobasidium sp. EXF-12344]KAI4773718.1 translation initiation factor eIF3 subunit [Aureobasidium sp. EXF-3400]
MAGNWDDEESSGSSPSSPQIVARRGKFDDEEEDGDVLDSWDAAEDSEVEREKAKKAADAKAKAEEEAKKNHKSKSQRIEERRQENMRKRLEGLDFESDDEDESERRARLRREQKESDLKHAEDLFDGIGVPATRSNPKAITVADAEQPGNAIDLSAMPLFNPTTKDQFTQLRDILGPLLVANVKKAQYTIFMQEFAKDIVKELPSDQIKKIASGLTTLSNEKMREEKEAAKGGKKSKAQKTKTTLAGARNLETDTTAYDDGLDE